MNCTIDYSPFSPCFSGVFSKQILNVKILFAFFFFFNKLKDPPEYNCFKKTQRADVGFEPTTGALEGQRSVLLS